MRVLPPSPVFHHHPFPVLPGPYYSPPFFTQNPRLDYHIHGVRDRDSLHPLPRSVASSSTSVHSQRNASPPACDIKRTVKCEGCPNQGPVIYDVVLAEIVPTAPLDALVLIGPASDQPPTQETAAPSVAIGGGDDGKDVDYRPSGRWPMTSDSTGPVRRRNLRPRQASPESSARSLQPELKYRGPPTEPRAISLRNGDVVRVGTHGNTPGASFSLIDYVENADGSLTWWGDNGRTGTITWEAACNLYKPV
jgi:hypothetical protein